MNESPDKSPIANRDVFASVAPDKPLSTAPTSQTAPVDIEEEIKNVKISFLFLIAAAAFFIWLPPPADSWANWLRRDGAVLFLFAFSCGANWLDYRFLLKQRAQNMSDREFLNEEIWGNQLKMKMAVVTWLLFGAVSIGAAVSKGDFESRWFGILNLSLFGIFAFALAGFWRQKFLQKRLAGIYDPSKDSAPLEPESR